MLNLIGESTSGSTSGSSSESSSESSSGSTSDDWIRLGKVEALMVVWAHKKVFKISGS